MRAQVCKFCMQEFEPDAVPASGMQCSLQNKGQKVSEIAYCGGFVTERPIVAHSLLTVTASLPPFFRTAIQTSTAGM